MKFETKIINFFAGCLQIPIPAALIALIGELQQAANGAALMLMLIFGKCWAGWLPC